MNKEKLLKIFGIVDRAVESGLMHSDRLTLKMDLEYAEKEFSLDLNGLLEADDSDFSHDINGIQNDIDRRDKNFTGGFLPRFARA